MKRLLWCFLLACTSHAFALEDTPENRRVQAGRYLAAVPPKETIAQMAEAMVETLPDSMKEDFTKLMTTGLDIQAISKVIVDGLVKHFTADELKALADFYASPVGKSAMKKMRGYMGEVIPAVQEEVLRAQAKADQGK